MKRLKIGLFIDNFYPAIDGVVIAVDNLAKELSKYNDVVVVAPFNKDFDPSDKNYRIKLIKGIPIIFTEYKFITHKFSWSKAYKELEGENFDIIHIHSPFNIGKLGVNLAKRKNIPCIGTVHSRFDFEIEKIINIKLLTKTLMKNIYNVFNKCDKVLLVNDPLIEEVKKFGYKGKPLVVYNGTDLKEIKTNKESFKEINKLYNLENQKNVFIFVGRISDVKNIFFLLDSLKLLKEEKVDFKMLYVGTGPDENKLKEKIKEYKMEENVLLTGRIVDRNHLSLIYKRADLLLFPSLMDTSSLVRIEAAINETPGLFIKDSMVGLTVEDNKNGYLSSLDVKEYTNRIIEIINDKELLKKVSLNAKKTLSSTWKEVSKETYKIYLKEILCYNDKRGEY